MIGAWLNSEEEHSIVSSYEEKRIKHFNKEDIKELVEVVARWRLLLGVTSESSDTELLVITQFVYDNYPNITLTDIRFAMNWSISGRIEVGFVTQKNISSYYVSRAINAYIDLKRSIVNDIEQRRNTYNARRESVKIEQTPLQKANTLKNIVLNLYDSFKKEKQLIDYNDVVYTWLKKSKNLCLETAVIANAIRYGKQTFADLEKGDKLIGKINSVLENNREELEKKYSRSFMINHFFKSVKNEAEIVNLIKVQDFE